ncbi:MAG: outer membrane lipoprotein carrier protein LolA [Lentisphaerae bacterium]|nr:outer membrane lipoprotein carrier protein LolA [Lentisphaerota bacterium]
MPHLMTMFALLFSALALSAGETPALPEKVSYRVIAADFVQIRRLADLDMEVRITGRMVSELDGRLRWQVDTPVRSVTIIDREKLTHYDGETKKLSVIRQETFPWLRILRDSLDDWLSGDRARLTGRFLVSVPRSRTVRLVPRDREQKKLFGSVELDFAEKEDLVTAVRIEESSGEKLEIRFSQLRRDPPLPQEIWQMPPP